MCCTLSFIFQAIATAQNKMEQMRRELASQRAAAAEAEAQRVEDQKRMDAIMKQPEVTNNATLHELDGFTLSDTTPSYRRALGLHYQHG